MVRDQITLQGDDAERFRRNKEQIGEFRGGANPSNAELVRMMMDQFKPESVVVSPDQSGDVF